MKISNENKSFGVYVAKYLGVALIAGSVVHIGTLQNGFARYIALAVVGLVLMLTGNILEAKQNGEKINLNYLLLITGLAFATGFLSGGVQHYLDNPSYAGLLLGVGLLVSYITFFIKENIKLKMKNIIVVTVISAALILFSNYVMDDALLGVNHHGSDTSQLGHNKMDTMSNMHQMPDGSMMMNDGSSMSDMMNMTMNDMVKMMEGKTGKDLEKEFITGMIPHHQGAVDMAKKLLEDKTISPEMQKFANDIISAQEGEIKMMKGWIETKYK